LRVERHDDVALLHLAGELVKELGDAISDWFDDDVIHRRENVGVCGAWCGCQPYPAKHVEIVGHVTESYRGLAVPALLGSHDLESTNLRCSRRNEVQRPVWSRTTSGRT
jgi:hypothetical protein